MIIAMTLKAMSFPFREYALRIGHFPVGPISPIRLLLTSNINSGSTSHPVPNPNFKPGSEFAWGSLCIPSHQNQKGKVASVSGVFVFSLRLGWGSVPVRLERSRMGAPLRSCAHHRVAVRLRVPRSLRWTFTRFVQTESRRGILRARQLNQRRRAIIFRLGGVAHSGGPDETAPAPGKDSWGRMRRLCRWGWSIGTATPIVPPVSGVWHTRQ